MWKNVVSQYFKTCDRCQNANKPTGKILGDMIKIKEPRRPLEIVHMDWVTGLPQGSDISYRAFLVNVDRFNKTPIFFPCHKDDIAMDKALPIWNRVVSWTAIFTKIIHHEQSGYT
ncbi:hypothetical protein O181_052798 [Austropuccinia psidii MF-1]|uniref:Integrase zinc-binding domain-containing protein n=1 Tax=Austropuccinia psidii MF-1 TaxID=1389203 RepID=A0A9Q3HPT2_9BASI|nr:hypothetical protein [Austropuccinia psidii MF-1]